MKEVILDTVIDGIKLLPFLFITYIIMEFIEHKASKKTTDLIKKSGNFGPTIGGFLGIFPQCGFSAVAANLYAARIITVGTLISIFLSTSDEMLPILISEGASINIIIKILAIKVGIGILCGTIIDLIVKRKNSNSKEIHEICEHEHCHCENGIFKSALKHTIHIFIYIFVISLIINILIMFIGEENISSLILNIPILGPIISAILGSIPNCASSVILTQLYLQNVITLGGVIAGLLVNSGIGILILFKVNKNRKDNIKILSTLFLIGAIFGIIIDFIS